ncbi:o-succinylbenzoate synthase [Candidatus Promineifilum breve]|uniref:o-succinylbenzoate synthase n=1 Tax=Candidatus Promineifilum breve TaxID=1806508 RepID=A0A160T4H2_9CHLR|nr:o-succinylbenzoate synthase [Candidatus Promineifilum breve]CUS04976.2 o-succinylbenzoate synthase [Candidatus Promineifilum breve]
MKIERIDLYHVSMRLVSPFVTSFGPQQQRDCLLTAVHADGLTGWGESVATNDPGYSYETTGTAWHILSDFLIPALVGREIAGPEALGPALSFVRGHPLAKAALDQALWDLAAQADGVSLAAKLAEPYAEGAKARVPVGVSIGIQPSLERTVEVIGQYYDQGYRRIKLKIKPGHDVAVGRAARAAFPDLPIMLDANSAFRLEDAAVFQAMDELNLLMLEQPLGYEDIYDHSRLRPLIKTPLCLDESIHSDDHARYALAIEACDIINVKPSRVAGWTEARRIHDRCRAVGMPLWVGGMLETGVGRAAQLALAALPGFTLPGDISATERYYTRDITAPFTLNREDSTISVPAGPGLGVEIDHDYLAAVTLRRESFTTP